VAPDDFGDAVELERLVEEIGGTPQQAFPPWLRALAVVDPFTYPVHALKSVLLKDTGFAAITSDLTYMIGFSVATMAAATFLFKREL